MNRQTREGVIQMEHSVIIKGKYYGKDNVFPGLNDYIHSCSRHPQAGAKMKRDYQLIASNAIRLQLGKLAILNPVRIHYAFYEATEKRDPSNVASFFVKVFEDALQQCGVLKNDNWRYLKGYSQEFHIDRTNPRVEVTIEELDGVP